MTSFRFVPLLFSFLTITMCCTAQTIRYAEYFVDHDPGCGNAIAVTVTPADSIVGTFTPPLTGLVNGIHFLFIRVQDSFGRWSLPNHRMFWVEQIAPTTLLVYAEYFVDRDPGCGLGNALPCTPSDSLSLTFIAPVTGLANGMHTISIRVRDANGNWSHIVQKLFLVDNTFSTIPEIARAEYFFNIEPGVGNGIALPVVAESPITISFQAPATVLHNGYNELYVRVCDSIGKWSHPVCHRFWHEKIGLHPEVVRAEYYFDSDPAGGNGFPLTITPGDSVSGSVIIPLPTLSAGFHTFFLRWQNGDGAWSQSALRRLYVDRIPLTPPAVVTAEYYVDADPGLGMGIPIVIPAGDSSAIAFVGNMSGLHSGYHSLVVRVKDATGGWALPYPYQVYVSESPGEPSILVIRYIDTNAILEWTAATGVVTGYRIYRSNTAYFTPPESGVLIGEIAASQLTYTDPNAIGEYYYRVTAINQETNTLSRIKAQRVTGSQTKSSD